MGIIDFLIIIIFSVYIQNGIKDGLAKQVLSFAGWFLALIGAFLLFRSFARYLERTVIFGIIENRVFSFFDGYEVFKMPLLSEDIPGQISSALKQTGLPGILNKTIINSIATDINPSANTLAKFISPIVTGIFIRIIAFLFLFILFLFIGKTIIRFVDDVLSIWFLSLINKLGSVAISLAKAFVIVSFLMLGLSLFSSLSPRLNTFLIWDLRLNESSFRVGKYLYNNNLLIMILSKLFGK